MKSILIICWALIANSVGEDVLVKNNCGRDIFLLNIRTNNDGYSVLGAGQSRTITVNRSQANSRIAAQIGCDGGGGNCDLSDSDFRNYASLAEFHWEGNGMTWFDVSHVDGYNLPVKMEPFVNSGGNCRVGECNFNLNDCPATSRITKDGRVTGCKNLNRDAPTEYSAAIKRACPGAYSWSKDDAAGMRACNPGNPGLTVTFC